MKHDYRLWLATVGGFVAVAIALIVAFNSSYAG